MSGSGVSYDYGFRIYDARTAKFLSVDPLTKSYPWYTPYQFAGNEPVSNIDLDGLEQLKVTRFFNECGNIDRMEIKIEDANRLLEVSYENMYATDKTRKPEVNPREQNLKDFISNVEGDKFVANWDSETKRFRSKEDQSPVALQFDVKVPTEQPIDYNVGIVFGDVYENENGSVMDVLSQVDLTNNDVGPTSTSTIYRPGENGTPEIGANISSTNPGIKALKETIGVHKTDGQIIVDGGNVRSELVQKTSAIFKQTVAPNAKVSVNSSNGNQKRTGDGSSVIINVKTNGGEVNNSNNIPKNKK